MTILLVQKCTFVECKNMMDQFYRIINNNNNGSIWEGRKKDFQNVIVVVIICVVRIMVVLIHFHVMQKNIYDQMSIVVLQLEAKQKKNYSLQHSNNISFLSLFNYFSISFLSAVYHTKTKLSTLFYFFSFFSSQALRVESDYQNTNSKTQF